MRMTKYHFLLILISSIYWIGSCSSRPSTSIKILSYNIKHGVGNDDSLDLSRALEVIKRQAADFVALQEVDHFTQRSGHLDQTHFLADALHATGNFGSFMDYQGGAYGMATLSSLPIISTKNLRLPDGIYEPRIAMVHEIAISDKTTILLANVHFDWVSGQRGEQSRMAQAGVLIKYLDQFDLPSIIIGDFNCPPDSPTMELFYSAGFSFASKGEDHLSFQGDHQVEIDHLILRATHSMHMTVKQIDLLDEPLVSDHRPLIAQIELSY